MKNFVAFLCLLFFGLSAFGTINDNGQRQWTLLNTTDSVSAYQLGTWNLTNITGTISLPTGAATSANQTSEITELTAIAANTASANNDTTASGSITTACTTEAGCAGTSYVSVNSQGSYTISVSITGTFVGTYVVDNQLEDGTWVTSPFYIIGNTLPLQSAFSGTTVQQFYITGGGVLATRVRCTAYTSGTINVGLDASASQQTVSAAQLGNWLIQGSVPSGTTDFGNGVKVSGVYNTTVPAITNGQRSDLQTDSRGALQTTPLDGSRATYSTGLQFTAANAATDILTIQGSATKTVRILRIWISGTQTTAGIATFFLLQRYSADTGGTIGGGVTQVRHNSSTAGATATINYYTANPTALGANGGTFAVLKKQIPTATSTIEYNPLIFDYGNRPDSAIVLRGTLEWLAINLNGATLAGNSLDINIEYTEE